MGGLTAPQFNLYIDLSLQNSTYMLAIRRQYRGANKDTRKMGRSLFTSKPPPQRYS